MQRKSRQISTHFAIRVGRRFHDCKCACGFEIRIKSSARDASKNLPEEPRPNPNPNPNRVAIRFHMHCAIAALPFCIATLVAARSPVTQTACATRHLFRSREAEASKRRKVDKLILGFARAAGILTNMRNSQLPAAKQTSKGRSSGLHQSIEEELKEQVADVPFEVLQQAQSSGQLPSFSHKKKLVDTKRANKNRPMEVTSKKPVGRLREVIQAPKKDIRDPRFESLCGNFEEARFKKAYSFLYDEELPSERQRLQKVVKKGNAGEEVEEAEHKLAWIDRQLHEEEQRRKQAEQVTQFRAKEKDAVKQGKKHYYPKKSEKRKEELVRKYQELKATGKLEKFLEKRRRKNAAKDHRYLPYRRPESNQD